MTTEIWAKALWDQRQWLIGWTLALAGVTAVYAGFYSYAATPEYAQLIETLPPGLIEAFGWDDIASPHGYLGSTVFGLMGPILATVLAVGMGARLIAGDEESGYLELVAAHPVSRSRLLLQRALALGVASATAALVVLASILIVRRTAGIELSIANLAAASFQLGLLAASFGAFAFAAGAVTGRRAAATGVGALTAVIGYLANGLAPQLEALAWAQRLSPFYWYAATDTLRDGLRLGGVAVLAGLIVVSTAAAWARFRNRDLGT